MGVALSGEGNRLDLRLSLNCRVEHVSTALEFQIVTTHFNQLSKVLFLT